MNNQEQLINALHTNFHTNLTFLSQYDNSLYNRIAILSDSINQGLYKERFVLEFLEKEGDFDVLDTHTNTYLYDKKPKKINRNLINDVSFNGRNSIKSLEKGFYSNNFKGLEPQQNKEIKDSLQDSLNSVLILRDNISKFIKIFDSNINYDSIKEVEKFIFFGTLLGRHIYPIAEKVKAKSYFVCEKNLELFRLSLFVNDYKTLAMDKGVVFCIMEDEEEVEKKINIFLNSNPFHNYLLKFSSTSINVREYIESFLTSLVYMKPTTFAYNRVVYTILRNISEKAHKYKFLDFRKNENYTFFDDIPVLFVAAGPSLQDNIDWIKENQNKFFIVAVGASYKTLVKNDIKIDMVITLDASYEVLNVKQFAKEDVEKYLKDTIMLCSTITDKRFLERFSKDKLFIFEVGQSFFAKENPAPSYSVGEKAVDILLSMGIKNLYLVGLDLALNQDTGASHGVSSDSSTKSHDLNNDDLATFGFNTGLIRVKGNFCDEVSTTTSFKASKRCLDLILTNRKNEFNNIYNLSKHGAYFEHSKPLETKGIDIQKYDDIKINNLEVLEFFNQNSQMNLTDEIKEKIRLELDFINEIKFNKDIEFNSFEEFYKINLDLVNKLCLHDNDKIFIPGVFKNYFQIVLSYLIAMFNDKKIKNEKIKVNEVKDIFYFQIEEILSDYKKYLENLETPKSL